MIAIVTRAELRNILNAWQRGDLSAMEVYDWANQHFIREGYDSEDAISNEVLGLLDRLDIDLTTEEDIPTLIQIFAD